MGGKQDRICDNQPEGSAPAHLMKTKLPITTQQDWEQYESRRKKWLWPRKKPFSRGEQWWETEIQAALYKFLACLQF